MFEQKSDTTSAGSLLQEDYEKREEKGKWLRRDQKTKDSSPSSCFKNQHEI